MTRRHARYLREYPARIARKRLKRRRASKHHVSARAKQHAQFKKVLADFVKNRPMVAPVRAGVKPWHDPITRHFRRKPTV